MTTQHARDYLYQRDFYKWTQEQARLILSRSWDKVDWKNIAEEIESLGRKEKQELVNRLEILLGHLLKWQYQPHRRSNSWSATIREQRRKIARLIQANPSLKPYIPEALDLAYVDGIDLAVRETNLPLETFPQNCDFTLEQVLDSAFLPH
jgi:ribosomal protein L29